MLLDAQLSRYSYLFDDISRLITCKRQIFTLKMPFSHLHHTGSVSNLVVKNTSHPRPPRDEFPSDKLWMLVEDCMNFVAEKRPSAKAVETYLKEV